MTAWTNEELAQIGQADALRVACMRADGTLPVPGTIMSQGDDRTGPLLRVVRMGLSCQAAAAVWSNP